MILKDSLYKIKTFSPESKTFEIELLGDCFIYKAHFPGHPITPGVCIIQIAGEFLEELTGFPVRLASVSNAKFLAVINPEQTSQISYVFKKVDNSESSQSIKISITVVNDNITFTKLSLVYNRI